MRGCLPSGSENNFYRVLSKIDESHYRFLLEFQMINKKIKIVLFSLISSIALQAMESSMQLLRRPLNAQANASTHSKPLAQRRAADWEDLPLELKDEILSFLPGDDQFLNEMARTLNLSYPVYQEIVDAFLAYYLDKFQDFPTSDEVPRLINKHFKIVKSETSIATTQFLKAFEILRSQNALSFFKPFKEHIFRLWDNLCDERVPEFAQLLRESGASLENKRELRRLIVMHRYAIKLIDRWISSSLLNQCFYYSSKLNEKIDSAFDSCGIRAILIRKPIKVELLTRGLLYLPFLGDMLLENVGRPGLIMGFYIAYLGYLGASKALPFIIAVADLPAPGHNPDQLTRQISRLFSYAERILGHEFEHLMKSRERLENSLRFHEEFLKLRFGQI